MRQISDAHAIVPRAVKIHLNLEAISVRVEQAIPLALLLTEALTNAARHGLSGAAGCQIALSPSDVLLDDRRVGQT